MTAKRWVVRPNAHREVDEATDWYEDKRPGLGYALIEAYEIALASVQAQPNDASPIPYVSNELAIRRYFVSGFPYALIILETPKLYKVIAFAHAARQPLYWFGRK